MYSIFSSSSIWNDLYEILRIATECIILWDWVCVWNWTAEYLQHLVLGLMDR